MPSTNPERPSHSLSRDYSDLYDQVSSISLSPTPAYTKRPVAEHPIALITVTETGVVYSTERGELSHVTYLAARELHGGKEFPNPDWYPNTDEPAYLALGFDEDFLIQPSHIADINWLDDA